MKSLPYSIIAIVVAAGAAFCEPVILKVAASDVPKVEALHAAGMKFLNPLSESAEIVRLDLEGTEMILDCASSRVGPILVSSARAEFDPKDLVPPGKYYPPEPRVNDSTPLATLTLSVDSGTGGAIANDQMDALIPDLASAFSLPEADLRAYIEHAKRMPKATKPLSFEGTAGTALVQLTISVDEGEKPFSLWIHFRWKKLNPSVLFKSDQQAGSGQPATRSRSKSEGSDKPQPEAERRSR